MPRNWTESRARLFPRRSILIVYVLILLGAAILRLWGIPEIPPGPHYDEAANGILATEIAKGVKTPIFISSYTGKEVLFFYSVGAVMRLLGTGVLALRLTAAFLGLLTVAATGWLVHELFVDDDPRGAPWLALFATVLLATSFWHVVLSRIGFRAVTQPLLQTFTIAALWRGLRLGQRGERTANAYSWLLLGGVLFGLTGYTYLAARAFPIPLALCALVLWIADVGHRRQRIAQLAVFGLAALASFAPLGIYFVAHPDAFSTRMGQVGPGGDWRAAFEGGVAALKMLFLQGDPYIRFNLPLRPLFGPFVAAFFIFGLLVTLWRFLRPREQNGPRALSRAREALLLAWVPAMLLPTALAVHEITPSNLRAIGLIPLVFVFPARGIWALLNAVMGGIRNYWPADRGGTAWAMRITQHLPWVAAVLLLLTTFVATAHAYFRAYAPRTDLYEASDGDVADIAQYLNKTDLTDTTAYVGSIHYRHPTLAFLADAYEQIKWLVGASTVVYPSQGDAIYLFPRSAMPDVEWLARNLTGAEPLDAERAPDGAPAFIGYRGSSSVSTSHENLANFAGVVHLLGYQVEQAVSGDEADVTVKWQILAPPPFPGLTPFYHLEDPWGFRWGQAEPFHYAAEDWTAGDIILDRIRVPIDPGAPPGEYVLKAGLYSQDRDERLAVVDDANQFAGTTFPIALTVSPATVQPDVERLGIRERWDVDTGIGLTLLGANLDTAQVRPGEPVLLTLYWQASDHAGGPQSAGTDYMVRLQLQGIDGPPIVIYQGDPVHGTYPTGEWRDGEIVVDRYDVRLPLSFSDQPAGDYVLSLAVDTPEGDTALGSVVLGDLVLLATDRVFDVPVMSRVQPASLADQIELLGYDLDLTDARPGGKVGLTLYWRALTEMTSSYSVFTHVLGPDGQIVAQKDNVPVVGTYPTTLWLRGEVITDDYQLSLPDDLPAGEYPIEVGFYDPDSGLRLDGPVRLEDTVRINP
jgi:hypothetical protein